jgi:nicotinamide-nucleotide amidase
MVTVEIVVIGNEILLGLVQDTNSNYLCRMISRIGGRVRRVAIVRDSVADIAEEVKASIARRAELIFTCGGLGPTDDDLTLRAVAAAACLPLELNQLARDFVERRYSELASAGYVSDAAMTDARLKMALLPKGAKVLENPVGTAPAMMLELQGSRIISLPGVPAELKAIVEGPLQPLLGEMFERGSYREREIVVRCGDESVLAPALRQVRAAHPEVYIKSRASLYGRDVMFRILISASAASAQQAEAMIERASNDLLLALREAGIPA